MTERQLKPLLNYSNGYFMIRQALRDAPGLSMLTEKALEAISVIAMNAITEEVSRGKFYLVTSHSKPHVSYDVILHGDSSKSTCTCPAFTYRMSLRCKHIVEAEQRAALYG